MVAELPARGAAGSRRSAIAEQLAHAAAGSLGSALALVVLNCLQHLPCGLGFQFMVWKFTFGFVYCSWPGGLPVFTADGKQCIGGVGVSGSSGKDDVQVAEACMLAAGLSKLDDGRWAYTAVAENE